MASNYVNRNIEGDWVNIKVSGKDLEKIREKTLEDNISLMKEINEKAKDLSKQEQIAVFKTVAQHYHFRVENFVDTKLKRSVNIEDLSK